MTVLAAGCVVALAGCGRVDFDQMRRDHAQQFTADLQERTRCTLPQGQAVGLDDCIRIALANNLDVRAADIETRLAGLDRKIAFANFLPHVELSWNYRETSRAVLTRAGGDFIQTSDRGVSTVGIAAQQPIFMPQTWFLYSAYQKGEQISGLVRRRTRQLIALRAIALYYACLSQDEAAVYLRQSLSEGQALLDETIAMEREGLVLPAQRQAIEAMVLERRRGLDDNQRARGEARADLLETMGLSPLATIELAAESPIEPPEGDVADQVLEAMLRRPELHAADRTIEIRKDEVRMAIADFLPVVNAFTSYDHSSNSYLKYANTWAYGASAVLSVFDGFANIHRYRAARERQEGAFIEREQACLTVMLEVVKARRHLDDATEALAVAALRRQAAAEHLKNIESQWREGLIETSSRSAALADRDGAVAAEAVARYRRQVAAATLADVMGVTKEWSEQ
ncbi:MAG: TolC family protein [Planctomycetes bacterium]|nr:TolC family protein [Planctomycetota bacterium]